LSYNKYDKYNLLGGKRWQYKKEKATSPAVEDFLLQVSEKDLRGVFQENIEEIYLNGAKG